MLPFTFCHLWVEENFGKMAVLHANDVLVLPHTPRYLWNQCIIMPYVVSKILPTDIDWICIVLSKAFFFHNSIIDFSAPWWLLENLHLGIFALITNSNSWCTRSAHISSFFSWSCHTTNMAPIVPLLEQKLHWLLGSYYSASSLRWQLIMCARIFLAP